MKNRRLTIGCASMVIVAIVLFFVAYSGKRGVGTYVSQTYAGCYDRPNSTDAMLVITAQPGEELHVTHVSKQGWATVEYPEHGKLYTNFFGLTPQEVRYPISAYDFYDGSEALFMLYQLLLWGIFIVAILLLRQFKTGSPKATLTATILVAAEVAYTVIYFAYIVPADVLLGTAFDSGLGLVLAFLINMAGLALLGITHLGLILRTYAETKTPGLSTKTKILNWALTTFVVLFTLYIFIQLIVMAIVIAILVVTIAVALAIISFVLGYERSHLTLTKDPYSDKWMDGNTEYEVDQVRGTARKKKLFEL